MPNRIAEFAVFLKLLYTFDITTIGAGGSGFSRHIEDGCLSIVASTTAHLREHKLSITGLRTLSAELMKIQEHVIFAGWYEQLSPWVTHVCQEQNVPVERKHRVSPVSLVYHAKLPMIQFFTLTSWTPLNLSSSRSLYQQGYQQVLPSWIINSR